MDIELNIYHSNDIHNRLKGDFKEFPQKPDLLLDAGDAIGGSNTLFNLNEPILRKMGEFGYHAMVLGNREFHYIRSIMKRRREEAGFPFLSANLIDRTGVSNSFISPYLIQKVKGVKIALLGLTVEILPRGSFWEKIMKFEFLDPVDTLKRYLPELKEQSDILIILSHLGKVKDLELARSISDIDLIIGGHSHTPMEKPLKEGNTLITQAGFWASSFGHLTLNLKKIENSYIIDKYSFELIPMK